MDDYLTSRNKVLEILRHNRVAVQDEIRESDKKFGTTLLDRIIECVENQPTVDEKEIIQKTIECILKRLEKIEELDSVAHIENSKEETLTNGYVLGIKKAIGIVKKVGINNEKNSKI